LKEEAIGLGQPRKGTLEWYNWVEKRNEKTRSYLLAHTSKREKETSLEWLTRVNIMYQRRKIRRGDVGGY